MDFIELRGFEARRHALADRFAVGHGKTICGMEILNGVTGGCIVSMITCKRCVAILRQNGWSV